MLDDADARKEHTTDTRNTWSKCERKHVGESEVGGFRGFLYHTPFRHRKDSYSSWVGFMLVSGKGGGRARGEKLGLMIGIVSEACDNSAWKKMLVSAGSSWCGRLNRVEFLVRAAHASCGEWSRSKTFPYEHKPSGTAVQ